MTIPKFVRKILARSAVEDCKDRRSVPGHTLKISKPGEHTHVETFRREMNRLVDWVGRNEGEAEVIQFPLITCHKQQYARVVVCGPCMRRLKEYMANEKYKF